MQGYYDAGVTLHMQQMASFDAGCAIAAGDIATYLTNNPFDPAKALEQIGTQYWIASFLNGPEAFANFRRTGFPALAPNPYPGKEVPMVHLSGDLLIQTPSYLLIQPILMQQFQDRDRINWIQRFGGINKNFSHAGRSNSRLTLVFTRVFLPQTDESVIGKYIFTPFI